jgi:hypothetical protein
MVNRLFVSVVFLLMLFIFSCKNIVQNKEQPANQKSFLIKINDLKESKIDSLILGKKDSIKSKYLLQETPIVAYKHNDMDITKNNYIHIDSNYVFYPLDILKIADNYILLLIKKDSEIRAATFKQNGEPIETIIIYDTAGNNEWKVERQYDYNPKKNEFTFNDIKTDTEWIVFPTNGKDIVSYKKESKVGIKNNGHFFLISQKDFEIKQ